MWNWFNCYLSGRHEFGVWCEPGPVFLRCMHCGRRSSGWAIDRRSAAPPAAATPKASTLTSPARVVPFTRVAS